LQRAIPGAPGQLRLQRHGRPIPPLSHRLAHFIEILVALFAPPAATTEGFSSLARLMGLRFDYDTDDRTTRVTAAQLEKRHGKNRAWSATAYDKRARVGHMRQGSTLDPVGKELIDHNVRFDMTARGSAIMEIIGDAQPALQRHRERFPRFLEHSRATEFPAERPEQTARWLDFRNLRSFPWAA
jgi:hypothetical protein